MRSETIVRRIVRRANRPWARRCATAAALTCAAIGACWIALLVWPMDTSSYCVVSPSPELEDRRGALLYAFPNTQQQWCFVRRLDELGPRIVQATLAAEDRRFYAHRGVDGIAMTRALWQNLSHRRIVSGASTITMQLVKTQGGGARSFTGKATQLARAIRLERRSDKENILCAYLNKAPYGLNLTGVEAASRRYFGKPARELSLSEAALLAGLPKAPTASSPLKNPIRAVTRRNYVLRRMRANGFIGEREYQRAVAEPLTAAWHDFPKLAPHLAMRLQGDLREHGRVRVTLDAPLQRRAENVAESIVKQYENEIGNAAIMVADVSNATILAYVGSSGFLARDSGGQFDACRGERSPGSALKPFTYGVAMDLNRLYASEMLLDDSLDLGAYGPANYDGTFTGVVSASDALKHSLNIPAVLILARVGVPALYDALRNTGVTTLSRPPESYGLGLTLGNCEIRLDELIAAYAMIANLGEHRPLRFVADSEAAPIAKRCLTRGACLKLFDMLQQPLPGDVAPGPVRIHNLKPRVCWKTGTSTGHFDAWAFVFNTRYVVGVWLGNNKGKPSNQLVGAEAALPAAAAVFRSLDTGSETAWPSPGDDLRVVRVCAISGLPASPYCGQTREVTLPRSQYLTRICDVHRPAMYASAPGTPRFADGLSLPALQRLPGSAKDWDLAHIVKTPADLRCDAGAAPGTGQELRILEPADKSEYVLTGEPHGDRVRVRSSLDADATLHWYMDDAYLGAATPSAPLVVDLVVGSHVLACTTSSGVRDKIVFNVAQPDTRVRFGRR